MRKQSSIWPEALVQLRLCALVVLGLSGVQLTFILVTILLGCAQGDDALNTLAIIAPLAGHLVNSVSACSASSMCLQVGKRGQMKDVLLAAIALSAVSVARYGLGTFIDVSFYLVSSIPLARASGASLRVWTRLVSVLDDAMTFAGICFVYNLVLFVLLIQLVKLSKKTRSTL
eukprot:CAMPEP_0170568652 /NCGR_PEP_ID=MMETSP0224-20130122/72_1 /TAXON_ID=285029 /ORGANISM="Togula jolla, Strain CCCM 725" /LENGTH=172 /DNA_ID=CAMNT_0010890639 /DNA_START=69 /DNA_END=587 /DNA_ORIENTATION=-